MRKSMECVGWGWRIGLGGLMVLALGCSSSSDDGGGTGADGTDGATVSDVGDVIEGDGMEGDASGLDDVEQSDGQDAMLTDSVDGSDVGTPEDTGDTGGTTGVDVQPPMDTTTPTNGCTSSSDGETLTSVDLFSTITGCASQCVGQMGCAAECVQTQTGLSSDCSACAGAATECAASACGLQCVGGANDECYNCVQSNCGASFTTCAGIGLPAVPPCTPACDGKDCGLDGCGSVCGVCMGSVCDAGVCTAIEEDACDNDGDAAIFSAASPKEAATNCGLECLFNPDVSGCSVACIIEATGLSAGCSLCVGEHTGCSATNCLLDCFDATSPACQACEAANCNSAFMECAGVPFPGGLEPGKCDNGDDATALAGLDTKVLMADCYASCDGTGEEATCAADCTADEGLTAECGGCVGEAVTCMLDNCGESCTDDPTTPACANCAATSCNTAFQACAGLNLTDLYPCAASCDGKSCGLDGCGGSCGSCEGTNLCVEGACEPLENAWCDNETDAVVLESADPATAAQDCSLGCLGQAEFGQCVGVCTADGTGLSEPCSLCFGLQVDCAFNACLNDCSADPAAQVCLECLDTNCAAGFEACTGLFFTDFYGQ